jgi:hypothetical protein
MPFEPVTCANGSPRRRVEVENDAVWLAQPVGAGEPHVRRDRVLADQVDERVGAADQRVRELAAALLHLHPADPAGVVLGHVLLEEALAADAVGKALQAQRPVADVRQHPLRHRLVVVGQIGLGHAVVREQQLVGVRDLDAQAGRSLTTSRAGLSSRRPR